MHLLEIYFVVNFCLEILLNSIFQTFNVDLSVVCWSNSVKEGHVFVLIKAWFQKMALDLCGLTMLLWIFFAPKNIVTKIKLSSEPINGVDIQHYLMLSLTKPRTQGALILKSFSVIWGGWIDMITADLNIVRKICFWLL